MVCQQVQTSETVLQQMQTSEPVHEESSAEADQESITKTGTHELDDATQEQETEVKSSQDILQGMEMPELILKVSFKGSIFRVRAASPHLEAAQKTVADIVGL